MARKTFPWSMILAAVVTFALGIFLVLTIGDRFFEPRIEKPVKPPVAPSMEIKLYFGNEEDNALKHERRRIKKATIEEELSEALEELIKGPSAPLSPTIPQGTKLLSIKIKNSIAYVNLSKEVSSNHPGGSSAELQTIYSIVNTITLNFPEIKMVQLLIEGDKKDTLAGHILIKIPLSPDKKMIKG